MTWAELQDPAYPEGIPDSSVTRSTNFRIATELKSECATGDFVADVIMTGRVRLTKEFPPGENSDNHARTIRLGFRQERGNCRIHEHNRPLPCGFFWSNETPGAQPVREFRVVQRAVRFEHGTARFAFDALGCIWGDPPEGTCHFDRVQFRVRPIGGE